MFKVLIVEDDSQLAQLFNRVLLREGYYTFIASDGKEALKVLDKEYIDIIISDIMMPNMDGYELTKAVRESENNIPILLITAKDSFDDMRKGFSLGSDDYMIKPVNVNELVLRVNALLRRAKMINERKQTFGSVVLEYDSMTVYWDGEKEILPQKEFMLLFKLISSPGRIFTRQQLMDEIWGVDSASDTRTVDVHINRLRDKFRDMKDFEIVTVRGLGYKVVKKNA